jgi:phosphatidylserine decarboxylase
MLINANLGKGKESVTIAFVAIGGECRHLRPKVCSSPAMLVGSIGWSKKPGDKIAKGEELGWFQVGRLASVFADDSTAARPVSLFSPRLPV